MSEGVVDRYSESAGINESGDLNPCLGCLVMARFGGC